MNQKPEKIKNNIDKKNNKENEVKVRDEKLKSDYNNNSNNNNTNNIIKSNYNKSQPKKVKKPIDTKPKVITPAELRAADDNGFLPVVKKRTLKAAAAAVAKSETKKAAFSK